MYRPEEYSYINPESEEILAFAKKVKGATLFETCENIRDYFDENIEYNRLDSPYFPLQRNDLDTLKLKSGTCGDYSNLVVSTLRALGYDAKYAYLGVDLYGDSQDHICALVYEDGKEILVDMTYPYRKWHFYDTGHKEYEPYQAKDFEKIMKNEEKFWYEKALEFGNENYAGLLYAPWIHNEIISEDEDSCSSLLYLLMMSDKDKYSLLLYYYKYTENKSDLPFLIAVSKDGAMNIRVSLNDDLDMYDEEKFSSFYPLDQLPAELYTEDIDLVIEDYNKKKDLIKNIIP